MKRSIFVSRRIPETVRVRLEHAFDLRIHDSEQPLERSTLLAASIGMDGLLTMLTDRIDEELLNNAGPQLKLVANFAVGYDNIDVDAATQRDVLVANTPDVLTHTTAEFTIALILDLVRRVSEGDRFLRRRENWNWTPTFMLGTGLRDRTLGIVGFGRIGRQVARLGHAFGMAVLYTNRSGQVVSQQFDCVPLGTLLRRADVISLHCPLTSETHHLIDARALSLMRTDSVLVNTSRGPVVDERALADALAGGRIAGAALDVFEREPEVCTDLLGLDNVIVTPHLGSATHETREAMGMLCADALTRALLDRQCPRNVVNPEAWHAST